MSKEDVLKSYEFKNKRIEEFISIMEYFYKKIGDNNYNVIKYFNCMWRHKTTGDGKLIAVSIYTDNGIKTLTCDCVEWTDKYLMIELDSGLNLVLDSNNCLWGKFL